MDPVLGHFSEAQCWASWNDIFVQATLNTCYSPVHHAAPRPLWCLRLGPLPEMLPNRMTFPSYSKAIFSLNTALQPSVKPLSHGIHCLRFDCYFLHDFIHLEVYIYLPLINSLRISIFILFYVPKIITLNTCYIINIYWMNKRIIESILLLNIGLNLKF